MYKNFTAIEHANILYANPPNKKRISLQYFIPLGGSIGSAKSNAMKRERTTAIVNTVMAMKATDQELSRLQDFFPKTPRGLETRPTRVNLFLLGAGCFSSLISTFSLSATEVSNSSSSSSLTNFLKEIAIFTRKNHALLIRERRGLNTNHAFA